MRSTSRSNVHPAAAGSPTTAALQLRLRSMTATKTKSELSAHLAACESFAASAPGAEWLRTLRRNGVTHFTELGFPGFVAHPWDFRPDRKSVV